MFEVALFLVSFLETSVAFFLFVILDTVLQGKSEEKSAKSLPQE
jgi:hypothetical protein